jgi:endogenous inhibitor of DNA gyrase (YacG/DUF329 family)
VYAKEEVEVLMWKKRNAYFLFCGKACQKVTTWKTKQEMGDIRSNL